MRRPRLWVIDPSMARAEDQGVEQILQDWPGESRVLRPALSEGDGPTPADAYDADGVVLIGSRASVQDDHPWLSPLADWLRPMVDGEVELPLLGICFGHQLMAHLAGGAVGFVRPDRSKLLGIEESTLKGGRLIPEETRLRVVVSHHEEVKRPPRGYRVVASRRESPIDGLEHERLPVFTFQFHPEARDQFLAAAGLDPAGADERLAEDSQRLLGAFRSVVLRRAEY